MLSNCPGEINLNDFERRSTTYNPRAVILRPSWHAAARPAGGLQHRLPASPTVYTRALNLYRPPRQSERVGTLPQRALCDLD